MSSQQLFTTLTPVGGYRPVTSTGGPDASSNVLYRGSGFWVRPGGRLKPVKGSTQISSTNLGPRIYPLNQYRGEIGGALVSGALPKEALVRYQGSALFFVSENTSQQVYINESTVTPFTLTGVTTSSVAGKLRVALLNSTTYTAYDAGVAPPTSIGTVSTETGGSKSMNGVVSIVACARRTITDSTSNPTPANVQTLSSGGNNRIRVVLPALGTGTDGWWYGGTSWAQGNTGPWRLIREVLSVVPGTSTFTNGSNAVSGAETRYLTYLRNGDKITVNATDYYVGVTSATVAALYSDAALTTPVNFAGATGTYSITMKEIVLDWRNGELTDQITFDNDVPPLLDGLLLFNDVPFGWRGNTLYPSKIGNPEAWPPALARSTQTGADIIWALAGDARIYLLTRNSMEVVTFTQQEGDPFLIRQAWGFGFSSPTQACVAEGVLYAAVGTSSGVKILRTRVDDSPDLEFSANIESDLASWNIENVVMTYDASNGAVLAVHNDGTNTTIIPYMLQQGVWSLPQSLTGRVKDAASSANVCSFIVYDGTNFRAYQYEGGNGTGIDKYVCWPWLDTPSGSIRKILKRLKVIADADTVYLYAATPGVALPDVTSTGAATVSFTLNGSLRPESLIQTNVQNAQLYAVRIDSNDADAEIIEAEVWGLLNAIGR
jgi:hypothetical protein